MDVKSLIKEVRRRRSLWNGKDRFHNNRSVVDNLWKEVAAVMDVSRNAAKTKWRGLRDTFRKELNKAVSLSQTSGDPTKELPSSNWIHFEDLVFLKDVMLRAKSEEAVKPSKPGSDHKENSPYDTKVILLPDESNSVETETHFQNILGDLGGTSRGLKRTFDELEVDPIQRTLVQQTDDDDYRFLMSMLPTIRELSTEKKMYIRWKFHELLYDAVTN